MHFWFWPPLIWMSEQNKKMQKLKKNSQNLIITLKNCFVSCGILIFWVQETEYTLFIDIHYQHCNNTKLDENDLSFKTVVSLSAELRSSFHDFVVQWSLNPCLKLSSLTSQLVWDLYPQPQLTWPHFLPLICSYSATTPKPNPTHFSTAWTEITFQHWNRSKKPHAQSHHLPKSWLA